jgi:hypothetical protein
MAYAVAGALAPIAALVARAAHADAPRPTAELQFVAQSTEPSCPSEREFRDRVVARVGFDPFVAAASRRVVVTLRDEGSDVHAEARLVSLSDATPGATSKLVGRRELTAKRSECAERPA